MGYSSASAEVPKSLVVGGGCVRQRGHIGPWDTDVVGSDLNVEVAFANDQGRIGLGRDHICASGCRCERVKLTGWHGRGCVERGQSITIE